MDAAIAEPAALQATGLNIARPRSQARVPALDALRGVAVIMVMLCHVGGTYPGPAASGARLLPALDVGAHGVDLFFVLSGF